MSIDNEGYLSTEISKIEADIIRKNKDYFALARKVNSLCHTLKFRLDIKKKNAQEIAVSTLFISFLESLSSTYILLSKGLLNDSNVILRCMLEKTLKLKYVSLSYENALGYHKAQERQRLRIMNAILSDKEGVFSGQVKGGFTEEERKDLAQRIKIEQIKDLPDNEQLARITELSSLYQNIYRLLNDNVHSNAGIISQYFKSNEEGEFTDLTWFSLFNDIDPEVKRILYTVIYLGVICIETTLEVFTLEEENLEDIVNELNKLGESFKRDN